MAVQKADQLAIDEVHINDPDVEQALESRESAREGVSAAKAVLKGRDSQARSMMERLEMPEPDADKPLVAVRVGRFRITKRFVKGSSVAFSTEDRTQLRIGLVSEAGDEASTDEPTDD